MIDGRSASAVFSSRAATSPRGLADIDGRSIGGTDTVQNEDQGRQGGKAVPYFIGMVKVHGLAHSFRVAAATPGRPTGNGFSWPGRRHQSLVCARTGSARVRMARITAAMPKTCVTPIRSPRKNAASATAGSGGTGVSGVASLPLTLAAPAYQRRNPPTVGMSAYQTTATIAAVAGSALGSSKTAKGNETRRPKPVIAVACRSGGNGTGMRLLSKMNALSQTTAPRMSSTPDNDAGPGNGHHADGGQQHARDELAVRPLAQDSDGKERGYRRQCSNDHACVSGRKVVQPRDQKRRISDAAGAGLKQQKPPLPAVQARPALMPKNDQSAEEGHRDCETQRCCPKGRQVAGNQF